LVCAALQLRFTLALPPEGVTVPAFGMGICEAPREPPKKAFGSNIGCAKSIR
jgi:hypothetical protein